MIVIGVDPGTYQSAFVVWDGEQIKDHGILPNELIRGVLLNYGLGPDLDPVQADVVVLEQVESYGMAVGREVFQTVLETGRFFQIVEDIAELMPRKVVKSHLCHTTRANNSNIRAALIDRFGGSKAAAIGLKKTPGPLYGVRSHEWSALALAVTWLDQHDEGETDDSEKEGGEKEGGRTEARRGQKAKAADRHAAGHGRRRRRA